MPSIYQMLFGAGLYGVVAIAAGAAGVAVGAYAAKMASETNGLEEVELDGGEGFKLSGPARHESRLESMMKAYGARRQKRKAVSNGTVRWHLAGSTFSEPMYVEPERKAGGNMAELEHEGETYVFPESSMVPAEGEGVPTVIHREGESEPIDLRSHWDLAIKANTLKEYLTLRVTSSKPSGGLGLGIGDWDSMDVLRYGIAAMVLLFVVMQVFG